MKRRIDSIDYECKKKYVFNTKQNNKFTILNKYKFKYLNYYTKFISVLYSLQNTFFCILNNKEFTVDY